MPAARGALLVLLLMGYSLCGVGAAENASPEQRIAAMQDDLLRAAPEKKRDHVQKIADDLDRISQDVLAGGAKDPAAAKQKLEGFCPHGRGLPLVRVLEVAPQRWIVGYNVFTYANASVSILTAFEVGSEGVRKVCSYGVAERSQLGRLPSPIGGLWALEKAGEAARDSEDWLVVSGIARTESSFVLIKVAWDKRSLVPLDDRNFGQPNGTENTVQVEGGTIISTYVKGSGTITEGWGDCMLQWEERFGVENDRLASRGRKLLNPWHESVIQAVRLQKDGDREKFDAVCADKKLWGLLAGSQGLACEKQEATGESSAAVVLRLAREREEDDSILTLRVEKKEAGWIIVKADESKPETKPAPREDAAKPLAPDRRLEARATEQP